ncbi:MAG TPA: rhamnulokinase [bacterium]|nr:rhamnulokinase [bacterium]
MSSGKYIAVDLGASSGRVMLAEIGGTLRVREIHRFPNSPVSFRGHLCWNFSRLFHELKRGLSKTAAAVRGTVTGIGVDTWGVDFGFVGRNGDLLGHPFCYRDTRTRGMMETAFGRMSRKDIYAATGIQFMELNSLYQLLSMVESRHPDLDAAETLLFMSDLFHFMMTGERITEYTIASTSQLLHAHSRTWDEALFERIGLPRRLMGEIRPPGTVLGPLKNEIREETGLRVCRVIAPASHDTAGAVAAVPAAGDRPWAYLSSGTWSLIGVELEEPLINEETLESNFTNEGGVGETIRFLKNVTGLWLVEACRTQWGEKHASHEALMHEAKSAPSFRSLLFPDDPSFLNPPEMPGAIREFCVRTGQPVPESRGQFVRAILESLALRYRQILRDIDRLTGRKIEVLHIVGGGSRNDLLNRFTADACGIPVLAGPAEATAIGNVIIQAVATGDLESLASGRRLVADSFEPSLFFPGDRDAWDEAYARFSGLQTRPPA